jgi:Leucine-rich repeat (LRR) protein
MISDANFEQALINLGYDNGAINGSVYTALINTVTYLNVDALNIAGLTGIEDFTALIELRCQDNQLTSHDVSQNTALTNLFCNDNQLTSLDVSNNTALTWLKCNNNQLTTLDIRNGNNISMDDTSFFCAQNPNLTCIDVDAAV